MYKFILITLYLFFHSEAFAINLLQETQDILCQNSETQVLIEKKDKYFETKETNYQSTEFLDKGILGESTNGKSALIQITPKNTASLIEGSLIEFRESDCKQVKAYKVCKNSSGQIEWAPTYLKVDNKTLNLQHYGVYPNDGTFFIAYNETQGIALIDFGSNFLVLSGTYISLSCSYLP